jgi:catechol 2,3-dioxygenase-like lactoylglutathione lyase family enzyme
MEIRRHMRITASAISLNVDDPKASAVFVARHLGFEVEMESEGFISLALDEAGMNLIFLRVGLETFKPASMQGHRADGLLVVFVVNDIDHDYERLVADGVVMTTPLETEPWGERFCQFADPNGVVYQLVQWMDLADAAG